MHVHVISQRAGTESPAELCRALGSVGHEISQHVVAGPTVSDAADLGHHLHEHFAESLPDVVLAVGWLAGLAAQVATRETGTPVVQRLFSPGRSSDPDRRRLEGAIARGAAVTIALCSDDVDRLVALGVRRRRIRVVPHGVDTTTFRDAGTTWPAAEGRRVVARPDTDQASTRRLVGMLPSLPHCELVLLTTAATRPGATGAITDTVSHHPVGHRVRLLDLDEPETGTSALPALLRSADVVVVTGDDEHELDLALQAMACGRPVVARAIGAMADVVADGVTGVLVPPSASDGLGDAVRALLGDDLRRETYGLAAGDRARATFDWSTVGASVGRVLDEVAGEGDGQLRQADALDSR
jgi:glycosyltransferase involved in cell wall biosynthesis